MPSRLLRRGVGIMERLDAPDPARFMPLGGRPEGAWGCGGRPKAEEEEPAECQGGGGTCFSVLTL